jgi:hypothetical protein
MYEAQPLETEKYWHAALLEQQAELNRRKRANAWKGFVTYLAFLGLIPVSIYIGVNSHVWFPIVSEFVKSIIS